MKPRCPISALRLPACVIGPLLLCLLAAPALRAENAAPAPQVSETLSAELARLRTLADSKDYAGALLLIDRLLPASAADSFDRFLLSQLKARVLLTQGAYSAALAPLEEALALGDHPGFLADKARADTLYLLAQLHQQRAGESKDNLPAQRAALESAAGYLRRWQAAIPRPTPDGQLFAATLFYQQAILDPRRTDTALLAEAIRAAETGLALQLKPPASLYVLLLAAHQQLGENTRVAELLELLVAQNPANSGYWRQLVSAYLTLAADAPNERQTARFQLRAILTLERAQALGHLATPTDLFNLVALHLGLRQFAPAIALLEKGLALGTLDNTRRNWELLISAHQQSNHPENTLAATEKAVAALPGDGQLEFTLAQHHYASGRLAEARRHLELALRKGGLEKPGQTRLFLAYIAYELKDYPAAAQAAHEAAACDDVKKDDLARLLQAIASAKI